MDMQAGSKESYQQLLYYNTEGNISSTAPHASVDIGGVAIGEL